MECRLNLLSKAYSCNRKACLQRCSFSFTMSLSHFSAEIILTVISLEAYVISWNKNLVFSFLPLLPLIKIVEKLFCKLRFNYQGNFHCFWLYWDVNHWILGLGKRILCLPLLHSLPSLQEQQNKLTNHAALPWVSLHCSMNNFCLKITMETPLTIFRKRQFIWNIVKQFIFTDVFQRIVILFLSVFFIIWWWQKRFKNN